MHLREDPTEDLRATLSYEPPQRPPEPKTPPRKQGWWKQRTAQEKLLMVVFGSWSLPSLMNVARALDN
jgi:hypothetical protein